MGEGGEEQAGKECSRGGRGGVCEKTTKIGKVKAGGKNGRRSDGERAGREGRGRGRGSMMGVGCKKEDRRRAGERRRGEREGEAQEGRGRSKTMGGVGRRVPRWDWREGIGQRRNIGGISGKKAVREGERMGEEW